MPPMSPPPPTETSTVSSSRLLLQLQAEGALPQQRLVLVERVHLERAGAGGPGLAGLQRVGVAVAGDHQRGAVGADRSSLAGEAQVGTKILAGRPSRRAA